MPPVLAILATATGVFVAARYLKREWERVNRELDAAEPIPVKTTPTLRRDPHTGEWRVVNR
ncbi:MAG: hypothetical protein ACK50Q_09425 [Labrys sp. (in: a-proteobacteria)]|jgi:hypothetical protein